MNLVIDCLVFFQVIYCHLQLLLDRQLAFVPVCCWLYESSKFSAWVVIFPSVDILFVSLTVFEFLVFSGYFSELPFYTDLHNNTQTNQVLHAPIPFSSAPNICSMLNG